MFNIEFYSNSKGVSELWDFLEDLQERAVSNKDARIQHKQIAQYIQLLADHGTRLGEKITKHLEEDIWELRPGNNRVLFFITKTIPMFFSTSSAKKHRKLRAAKSIRPSLNAMTGNPGRGDILWQHGMITRNI